MTKKEIINELKFAKLQFQSGDTDINSMLESIERVIHNLESNILSRGERVTQAKVATAERRFRRMQQEEARIFNSNYNPVGGGIPGAAQNAQNSADAGNESAGSNSPMSTRNPNREMDERIKRIISNRLK